MEMTQRERDIAEKKGEHLKKVHNRADWRYRDKSLYHWRTGCANYYACRAEFWRAIPARVRYFHNHERNFVGYQLLQRLRKRFSRIKSDPCRTRHNLNSNSFDGSGKCT